MTTLGERISMAAYNYVSGHPNRGVSISCPTDEPGCMLVQVYDLSDPSFTFSSVQVRWNKVKYNSNSVEDDFCSYIRSRVESLSLGENR